MIRFYAPDVDRTGMLPADESAHAVRVLRHRVGDVIEAVDGRGHLLSCRLVDADPRGAAVEVLEVADVPKVWKPTITIAVAPTKNSDRMEWLVEKLVEIGVDAIVPVRCERSERRDIKHERLERIAVSAMKQSLKALLPTIAPTTPLRDFLAAASVGDACRMMGYCDADTPRRLMARAYTPGADATVLIGPEGDFSPAEVEAAARAGFVAVTMGDNRLRTETAALVAADTIHIVNQLFENQ